MSAPSDQRERDRFASELKTNFSVVASAGSGKTTAITKRIAAVAQSADALTALPRLVVLTFANRAADEMQQRAREEILRAPTFAGNSRRFQPRLVRHDPRLLSQAPERLRTFLGLPAPLELVTDDEDLWTEFVQQQTHIGRSLRAEDRTALLRFASIRNIMELGRGADSALLRPNESGPCPPVDVQPVLQIARAANRKSEAIANSIAQLKSWEENYRAGDGLPSLAHLLVDDPGDRRELERSLHPPAPLG